MCVIYISVLLCPLPQSVVEIVFDMIQQSHTHIFKIDADWKCKICKSNFEGKDSLCFIDCRVGGGSTYHSSGLLAVFKPSRPQVKLCQKSVELYKQLDEQGYPTGWKQCGSLYVARTADRMTYYRRMKAQSV